MGLYGAQSLAGCYFVFSNSRLLANPTHALGLEEVPGWNVAYPLVLSETFLLLPMSPDWKVFHSLAVNSLDLMVSYQCTAGFVYYFTSPYLAHPSLKFARFLMTCNCPALFLKFFRLALKVKGTNLLALVLTAPFFFFLNWILSFYQKI